MSKDEQFSLLDKTIAMVSHDAGGAEILSSHVRRQGLRPLFVLGGPAKNVFESKLDTLTTFDLGDALSRADMLLCSTSWQSDLEFKAIELSRSMGIPSVAFLDHWVNYRERFSRSGRFSPPDQIWVGDSIAKKIACKTFADFPVFLEENPYFLDIQEELAEFEHLSTGKGLAVLYVCEPIKEHAKMCYDNERHWGYVEEDALRYFLNNLSALRGDVREIRIRPHPSEAAGKYAWVSDEFNLPILTGGGAPLLTEIASCDVVVGCESMAMIIGLMAGKRVVSSIPPYGRECVLPHNEIVKLKNLIPQQNDRM